MNKKTIGIDVASNNFKKDSVFYESGKIKISKNVIDLFVAAMRDRGSLDGIK